MKDKEFKDLLKDQFNNKNDYEKLEVGEKYLNFSKRLPKKEHSSIFSNKKVYAFSLTFILLITLLIIIKPFNTSVNDDIDNPPNDENIDLKFNSHYFSYLVHSAAKQTLDHGNKELTFKPTNFQTTELSYQAPVLNSNSFLKLNEALHPKLEYPFDTIKITDPFRFEIEVEEGSNNIIETLVGSGNIEVIVSYIDLIVDECFLRPYSEEIIILRGPLGVYSCLTNGGSFDPEQGITTKEFSSHKYIEGMNIVKEKRTEDFKFFIRFQNDLPINLDIDYWYYSNPSSFNILESSYSQVNRFDLYQIDNLFSATEVNIKTTVDKILYNSINFLEVGNYNFRNGIIDEYTLITGEDGTVYSFSDLTIGTEVIITYYKFYDEFNPISAFLEKVSISPFIEINTTIESITESSLTFTIVEDYNLQTGFVDEFTYIIDENGNKLTYSDLYIGQQVKITYLKLSEEYNPSESYLTIIMVFLDNEETEIN